MSLLFVVSTASAALVGRAVPRPVLPSATTAPTQRAFPPPTMLLDPSLLDPSLAADGMQHLQDTFTNSLAFADQGGNLAGKFFQYSLAPYLGFLYFLKWEKNGTPPTAFFGFQFLLLFVLSTVFTGIVTKTTYESSLADVDWLALADGTLEPPFIPLLDGDDDDSNFGPIETRGEPLRDAPDYDPAWDSFFSDW